MSTITTSLADNERQRLNDMLKVADRAGVIRLSALIEAKVMGIDDAMRHRRETDAAVASAKADYDDAVAFAELTLGKAIRKEGAKTYIYESESNDRQVTADEARTWLAREVAKDSDVAAAASQLRTAEMRATEARDLVTVAERAFSAAEKALDASVATARLLELAFTSGVTR